jgi:hypothetical protein
MRKKTTAKEKRICECVREREQNRTEQRRGVDLILTSESNFDFIFYHLLLLLFVDD